MCSVAKHWPLCRPFNLPVGLSQPLPGRGLLSDRPNRVYTPPGLSQRGRNTLLGNFRITKTGKRKRKTNTTNTTRRGGTRTHTENTSVRRHKHGHRHKHRHARTLTQTQHKHRHTYICIYMALPSPVCHPWLPGPETTTMHYYG